SNFKHESNSETASSRCGLKGYHRGGYAKTYESPKKIISDVVKNLKNLRQAARGVQNGGNLKTAGKGSLNVAPGSSSTIPIVENIDKLERQILDGKLMFVDDDGKPLYKADSMGIANSDSEVEEVSNETTGYMASTSLKSGNESGYDTNSLLEQWRETKWDHDYDPYDDDLYESHDMSENLKVICGDFDITVRGWKKK
ncbi:hypothetical protein Tco_1454011, partial [Tanacetum coccineum]